MHLQGSAAGATRGEPARHRRWLAAILGAGRALLLRLGGCIDRLPSTRFPAIWLLALCLLLFLPGLPSIPPLDHAESWTAVATLRLLADPGPAQQAAGSGHPGGMPWLLAAAVRVSESLGLAHRSGIGVFRLPSLVAATGAVLAVHLCGRQLIGRRAAFLAALMLAGASATVVAAHLATAHASLLAATSACMGLLAIAYARPHAFTAIQAAGFWLALAAAVLLQGPGALFLPLLAVAALALQDGSARWLARLQPRWGLPLLLFFLVLPAFATGGGGAWHDHLVYPGAQSEPLPGHLSIFAATAFPVVWVLLHALPGIWATRRQRLSRVLLAWAASAWLAFSFAEGHPLSGVPLALPPMMLLAARWACRPHPRLPPRWFRLLAFCCLVGLAGAVAAGLVAMAWLDFRVIVFGVPASAAALLLLWLSLAAARAGAWPRAAVLSILLAIPIYGLFTAGTLSHLPIARAAQRIAGVGQGLPPGRAAQALGVLGFDRPSLLFASGLSTHVFPNGYDAARFLAGQRNRIVAVTDVEEAAFRRAAAELNLPLRERATILCLDLAELRFMAIVFYGLGKAGQQRERGDAGELLAG
jgi:4-amino-4-deoxy-L-arabinose transferase-like glycosyltransferase